jgi:predicted nucleotidyltransferase component of viral defense system
LIEYRYPLLAPPELRAGLPVPVASLDDLASMKLSAIAGRGAARDFWDLHTIVTQKSAHARARASVSRRPVHRPTPSRWLRSTD